MEGYSESSMKTEWSLWARNRLPSRRNQRCRSVYCAIAKRVSRWTPIAMTSPMRDNKFNCDSSWTWIWNIQDHSTATLKCDICRLLSPGLQHAEPLLSGQLNPGEYRKYVVFTISGRKSFLMNSFTFFSEFLFSSSHGVSIWNRPANICFQMHLTMIYQHDFYQNLSILSNYKFRICLSNIS